MNRLGISLMTGILSVIIKNEKITKERVAFSNDDVIAMYDEFRDNLAQHLLTVYGEEINTTSDNFFNKAEEEHPDDKDLRDICFTLRQCEMLMSAAKGEA